MLVHNKCDFGSSMAFFRKRFRDSGSSSEDLNLKTSILMETINSSNGIRTYMNFTSLSNATKSSSNIMFCVANSSADPDALRNGLNWACGQGSANCSAIQPGQPCYEENNLVALASYAYNDYYQKAKADGGTCDFGNTGIITTIDPSHGSCIFTRSPGASKGGESLGSQPPSNMAGSDGVILWQFARAAYLFTMMLHLCIYI